ncbi:hypothetical protein BX600DRAFT_131942 [Xylariales sp. PMI_506]|nr:hypothetical protein BX600DRAFT_131942 [Xylariales sp. PMI_506]
MSRSLTAPNSIDLPIPLPNLIISSYRLPASWGRVSKWCRLDPLFPERLVGHATSSNGELEAPEKRQGQGGLNFLPRVLEEEKLHVYYIWTVTKERKRKVTLQVAHRLSQCFDICVDWIPACFRLGSNSLSRYFRTYRVISTTLRTPRSWPTTGFAHSRTSGMSRVEPSPDNVTCSHPSHVPQPPIQYWIYPGNVAGHRCQLVTCFGLITE